MKIVSFVRFYGTKKAKSASIWKYLRSGPSGSKPEVDACRKAKVVREEPDLSRFGGQAYRTCGPAYVIQKDTIPEQKVAKKEEDQILAKIEADPSNKDSICDPMPPFRSVAQRMLDLNARKLHPFYKRYMSLPKRDFEDEDSPEMPFQEYKCKSGQIKVEDVPDKLQLNKQLLEKKNIFVDFKRVELPKQMVVRMVEMEKNRRPTLEKKQKE